MSDSLSTLLQLMTVALVVGSLAVNGSAIYEWSQGRSPLPRRYYCEKHFLPMLATIPTFLLLLLMVGAMFQVGGDLEFDPAEMSNLVRGMIVESVLISAVIMFVLVLGVKQAYQLNFLGFRTDDLLGQVRDGFYGFVMAFVPVSLMLLLCSPLRSEETLHPFLRLMQEQGVGEEMVCVAVSAIIMAPLKEELMFRVILQTWLCNYLGGTKAIILAAVIFAGVHGFPDAIGLLPLALILGYVYHQTRSFISVFVLHALFNAYNVFAMLVHVMTEAQ